MVVPAIHLKNLVQGIALVLFVLQMTLALQKYLAQPLMSSPDTKTLSKLQKPLAVTVCKTSQLDYAHAKDLTYMGLKNVLMGKISNTRFVSWAGPNGNMTFDETFNYLYDSSSENVYFEVENETVTTKFLLLNGFCKVFEGNPGKRLVINLKDRFDLLVTITDPAAATHFRMADYLMHGDRIQVKQDSTSKVYVGFRVKLRETIIETEDGSCVEYPNQNYESYADCVDDELTKKILPMLGCMVPWLSGKNHCAGLIESLPIHEDLRELLNTIITFSWRGQGHESDTCLQPCTTLSARSIYVHTFAKNISNDVIHLFFDETIRVERIVPAYGFGTLLVEIGSSLGLWLGLSVVGLFDALIVTVAGFLNLRKRLHKYLF